VRSGALVVTGGGRGIGARIAVGAARAGMTVALLYRSREDAANAVLREIEAAGGTGIAIAADVGSEADVARAFAAVDEAFGGVCGLVNNAAVPGGRARLSELRAEQLELVFRTNVFGAFFCAREAARRMSTKNGGPGGAIVSISSGAVNTGSAGVWVHYAASKGRSRRCRGASPRSSPPRAFASMSCAPGSSIPRRMSGMVRTA